MRRARALRSVAAVAALEFALVAPLFLTMVGGTADFGLAYWDTGRMALAVDAGAAYAFGLAQQYLQTTSTPSSNSNTCSTVQITNFCSDVQAKTAAALNLCSNCVTVSMGLYCVTTSATSSPPQSSLVAGTSGTACSNGNLPGTYMKIAASYTYAALMPVYSRLTSPALTETVWVRLW